MQHELDAREAAVDHREGATDLAKIQLKEKLARMKKSEGKERPKMKQKESPVYKMNFYKIDMEIEKQMEDLRKLKEAGNFK